MDLGIAILSFNHPDITARCVQSVLDIAPSTSVYLIHNGSRPEVCSRLREQFPQVNHHIYEDNRGYTGGVNRALSRVFVNHLWAFLITNDCELLQMGEIPKQPSFVAPLIWLRKTGRVNSLGGAVDWSKGKLRHCFTSQEWQSEIHRYIPGTAFLLHRDIFSAVGPFDEALHTYWEDVDFSQKVVKRGFPLEITEGFQLRHGVGKTCHRDPYYTNFLYQRNRRIVSRRYVVNWGSRLKLEGQLIWELRLRGLNKTAMQALNHIRPFFVRN